MFAKNAITATRVVYQRQRITIPSTLTATHVEACRDQDDDDAHVEAQRRHQLIAHRDFHATCKSESATIAAGLAVVAITAKASQYGMGELHTTNAAMKRRMRPVRANEANEQTKRANKLDGLA